MIRQILASAMLVLAIASGCRAQVPIQVEDAFPNLVFTRPVDFQNAGDGSNRVFVVEQPGRIRIFDNSPTVASAGVFLDIVDRVNSTGNEEGLLGLAFHPDYLQNGYFYVNYTADPPRRTVIARFKVSTDDPLKADTASQTILLTFDQPFSNHNGGQIAFGPDGYLYIATGDGGSGGDPSGNGQNRKALLGKILRIDVNREEGGRKYAIPPDNPFAGNTDGFKEEIFSYGMRNPWRFSFDPVTGRLWAGDVGQNKWEEVDIIEKGKNYGWNVMEGFHCYSPSTGCDTSGLVKPIIEYDHGTGISITGGHVYRGSRVPSLTGKYIYADFGSGRIWSLEYDGGAPAVNTEILASGLNISSFGVDKDRELYICTFSNGGKIYRFAAGGTDSRGEARFPDDMRLEQSYPNPAANVADFKYSVAASSYVTLTLADLFGRPVALLQQGEQDAGTHTVRRDVSRLPPGVYLATLTAGRRSMSNIMVKN